MIERSKSRALADLSVPTRRILTKFERSKPISKNRLNAMFLKELLVIFASGIFSTAYPTDATTKATGIHKLIELYLLMLENAIDSLLLSTFMLKRPMV
ncbi:unnamed protein product [Gongylonema pulchrum]|uniref:Uncharacterized protein n=1 Tax=Gongylonema pulchrum TaxID=637853 RepID=A0A183D0N1_9BILA|nr:unnamed protein product [Gongylonema pulchrum]